MAWIVVAILVGCAWIAMAIYEAGKNICAVLNAIRHERGRAL